VFTANPPTTPTRTPRKNTYSTTDNGKKEDNKAMAILEEQRSLCEDLERLEQACADRILEEPKTVRILSPQRHPRPKFNATYNDCYEQIRDRLVRDHQIAKFVDRFQQQSQRLLTLKTDADGALQKELESLTTHDPFDEFYRQLGGIKDFHRRYPNEPVENLERAYKRRPAATAANGEMGGANGAPDLFMSEIDALFTGEESNGRFFDLTKNHEEFLNLPGVKRIMYLQYLNVFDRFSGFTRAQKMSEKYFKYLTGVADYLESFLRRTRPLEDPDRIVAKIGEDFTKAWEADEVPGWGKHSSEGPTVKAEPNGDAEELYCAACQKSFSNKNVYDHHTSSKKHKKAVAAMESSDTPQNNASQDAKLKADLARLKDRAIAEREWRIVKLTELMKEQREATTTNVERKQSLTERERQMELEALYAEASEAPQQGNDGSEDEADDDSKIYNPLKLPLAWDGKPIPYWLYKLHGLGVEFPCEICGNFVYMGRRAFDKHFNEHRHIHGLRCLGITNTTLFREITKIDEAQRLWEKLEGDKKKQKIQAETVEEMEDAQGNVMPRKVFEDLQKQGLL
jgi:splicing factor 3A subunit 3